MRLWRNEKEVLKLITFVSLISLLCIKVEQEQEKLSEQEGRKRHTSNSILSGVVLSPNLIP